MSSTNKDAKNEDEMKNLKSNDEDQNVEAGEVTTSQSNADKKRKILIAVGVLVGVVVLVIPIVYFTHGSIAGHPKQDCSSDKFDKVKYNITNANGKKEEVFLKYQFVEDEANDNYYKFDQAVQACEVLGSTLVEILGGREEWEAIIKLARLQNKMNMWLNGEVAGSCPGGSENCLETEAAEGKGISVKWPSPTSSSYSRLYTNATEERRCIYVDTQKRELLWKTGECNGSLTAWGLCVKRNCNVE